MLDDKAYREWTSVFNSSSHFKGSWEKDSKSLFLGTDKDGSTGGMVSRIKENNESTLLTIDVGVTEDYRDYFERT